ncbi:Metalloreductase STEAP4-like 2 [Homarus americanus]|uniref:Metalloreductase STEAP4-like 2 n=1 Tax=Homarus americanus TaxID=6706 RepID=A0A8J5JDC0_HOMAM|nr:Metalloreductase STEAP4-like 2 [Homarus americanus]
MEMTNHVSNHVDHNNHASNIANSFPNHVNNDNCAYEDHVTNHSKHNSHAYDNHICDLSHENHTDSQVNKDRDRRVVLIGSGDMSRALVGNLVRAGYYPVIASRNPTRARSWVSSEEVKVRELKEGIGLGDLLVVAIPAHYHNSLPVHHLAGKIIVDISNRSPGKQTSEVSLAEQLQDIIPHSHVVKAFNTMSAYVLQRSDLQGGRQVPVCGNSSEARAKVMTLVRDMGLTPVDMGGLKNARTLEELPLSFFPEWKVPVIVAAIVLSLFWVLMLFRIQICPNLDSGSAWNWQPFQTLLLNNTQFSLAFTACFLLLTCYFPGLIAAYLQLWRGTKYSSFPAWLDVWLRARKQLGLLALLLGATHVSAILLAAMSILGISSLPSVSDRLTWREFSGLQRYLGWFSVVVVTMHLTLVNITSLLSPLQCFFLPGGAQIMIPLCFLTLLLKLPLILPCVDSHLTKIRGGYERSGRQAAPRQDGKLEV